LRYTNSVIIIIIIITIVSCILPTQGLVSSGGPTATLGTDVSRLPAQGCRPAFQLVLDKHRLWAV